MKNSRLKQVLLVVIPLVLLTLAMYLMLGRSWQMIWLQLHQLQPQWFAMAVLLSGCYYLADACGFRLMLRRILPQLGLREAVELIAMGLFMNVSTFGIGIKPAQAIYLKERGADVGESLGLLVMPYIFHKLTIVLYGVLCFALAHGFIVAHFADQILFIYLGYGLSVSICLLLVAILASERFHGWVFGCLSRLSAGERYQRIVGKGARATSGMRRQIQDVFKDKAVCIKMLLINGVKFGCWYMVPLLAFRTVGITEMPCTVGQCFALAAIMQLLIGVIPVTGGMISAEVVFVLLYSTIVDRVAAGSAMLVFRMATYYLPVLLSCFYSLWIYWRERHKRSLVTG